MTSRYWRFACFIVPAFLTIFTPALAAAYDQPGRGSALRAQIMDAVRPSAEKDFGAPVEFVVNEIRVGDGTAMVRLQAQRPGGAPIDLRKSPLHRLSGRPLDLIDGPKTEALLLKVGRSWQVVHHSSGATDVWLFDPQYCREFGDVLPEVCPARKKTGRK